ncbi:COG3650 family protein [Phenylobacterium sp. J367]|uniref:COG3650 family protein n=1 Tax=Phenylobacterium sp. J367 TaxID=2898435 RepID=UPI00215157BF|nr:hypothetical protein [Phenylobacterium sp. J367]MCR5878301.1 hypothetical protein [Phenylobacterium sp. J367]
MRPILLLAAALLLAACQPQAPDGAAAPAPADAPPAAPAPPSTTVMDLSAPILARGNEPFWAVLIDGTKLTLRRPGEPEKLFLAPGAQVTGGKASWEAKSEDGQALSVTLRAGECNDGMSDMVYPMSAEASLPGLSLLVGCAAKVSELPRE